LHPARITPARRLRSRKTAAIGENAICALRSDEPNTDLRSVAEALAWTSDSPTRKVFVMRSRTGAVADAKATAGAMLGFRAEPDA
jgi:hypothetical protein